MLCARCNIQDGVKEYNDELFCEHCYNIKTTIDNIIEIVNNNDRLRLERLIDDLYDKSFDEGYWQAIEQYCCPFPVSEESD